MDLCGATPAVAGRGHPLSNRGRRPDPTSMDSHDERPARAYDAVAAVWSPEGASRRYVQTMRRKRGVNVEPC